MQSQFFTSQKVSKNAIFSWKEMLKKSEDEDGKMNMKKCRFFNIYIFSIQNYKKEWRLFPK